MNTTEPNKTPSSQNYPPSPPSDEIDLSQIARKIKKSFSRLGQRIAYGARVVVKQLPLVLVSVAIGIVVAYFLYLIVPPVYESRMTIAPSDLRNDFFEEIIENLNRDIKDGNHQQISRNLNISPSIAAKIIEVSYTPLDNRRIWEDSLIIGHPFIVTASTRDKTIFDSLQVGIKHYLENIEYFVNLKAIRKQNLEDLISKLKQEIEQIDSVKMLVPVPQALASQSGILLGHPADPANIFNQGVDYFKEMQTAYTSLMLIDNFHVIAGFSGRNRPISPDLDYYYGTGGLLGFLVGLLLGVAAEKRKSLKRGAEAGVLAG